MDERLKIILIIIISVSIFGLLVFVYVKNYIKRKLNYYLNEKNKKIEAKKCSTGEQKSLLMGIILSHLELVSSFKSRYPVLLLDEVLAHFDKIRRKSFFKQIQEIGSQIIMTGTDISVFEELGDLEIYHLNNKKVTDIR